MENSKNKKKLDNCEKFSTFSILRMCNNFFLVSSYFYDMKKIEKKLPEISIYATTSE